MARLITARGFALYLALALAACTANGAAEAENGQAASAPSTNSASGLEIVPMTISGSGKVHRFDVEVARTSAQQAKGLMFRKSLTDGEGMIFPFPVPKFAGFWMKNTVIPLDLIFVRGDGTIESIAANAEPYSLDTISSGEPVAMVLEIRGGLAAELGLKAGDTVSWRDTAAN